MTESSGSPLDSPTPSSDRSYSVLTRAIPIVCLVAIAAAFIVSMVVAKETYSSQPTSGTGVVKSQAPSGLSRCKVTVDINGEEYTYIKTYSYFCHGVEDGSKVIIEHGLIK